jgi:hypothetical protein
MRRGVILYWVVLAALLALLVQVVSGFVLWIALPRGDGFRFRGSGSRAAHESFGFDRATWVDVHEWAAVALVAILLLHLLLNWRWVVSVSKRVFVGDEPGSR